MSPAAIQWIIQRYSLLGYFFYWLIIELLSNNSKKPLERQCGILSQALHELFDEIGHGIPGDYVSS